MDRVMELLKGRPVLVTGADGFVGSHLTELLVQYGAKVHVLVRPTSSGMLHNLNQLQGEITVHRGDVTDKESVRQVLEQLNNVACHRPIIFHLAAQAHVGESWNRPFETVACNILGTMNLLQSIVDLRLEIYKLDTAGSSEEFGNVNAELRHLYRRGEHGALILDETSPLNPQSIYATSKIAADFLTRNFFSAYGVPGVVTRMFNNYGPRQNPRFVTGTIITQALERDVIELGYLKSKRDFCFVKDGALGHIHAALFCDPGDVYTFGYGRNLSIEEWYRFIIGLGQKEGYWGAKELRLNESKRGRIGASEVEELRVDYSKLNGLTGWEPRYSWEEGLKLTIKWYAENRDRWITRVDW